MVFNVLDAPHSSMYRLPNYFRLQRKLRTIAPRIIPEATLQGAWLRFKFLGRSLLYGVWIEPWIEFLDSSPAQFLPQVYPKLYLKIQWPYLNRSYHAAKRLEIIRNHYQFVLTHFSEDLLFRIFHTESLYLARWQVPGLGTFSLRLSRTNKYEQEGEMVLSLYEDESDRLCSLISFSITGESEISIGCSQGDKPSEKPGEMSNKDFIISFTRKMFGMRPKNLLLFALRHMAGVWSINKNTNDQATAFRRVGS